MQEGDTKGEKRGERDKGERNLGVANEGGHVFIRREPKLIAGHGLH